MILEIAGLHLRSWRVEEISLSLFGVIRSLAEFQLELAELLERDANVVLFIQHFLNLSSIDQGQSPISHEDRWDANQLLIFTGRENPLALLSAAITRRQSPVGRRSGNFFDAALQSLGDELLLVVVVVVVVKGRQGPRSQRQHQDEHQHHLHRIESG